ncbi:ErfK/YbiS/YcfS/YnhG family protein [Ancylobacter novellus DSM 506]|uniref:ErfK/YbiS/YcfS/YnhG family protein n=1 Tax=Ancylobacter novellus (strain ATCC 8093 / DSM 506 / JCM 20403 / CCM 1077 / IAM 12100 / NBRC 12443 / NCIMB 10456) TaxID=639283 RepID=D7A209_ANCN5|nr:L,D-transpeptidase [Ancylobacter novellus]ADH87625.1 ErfK/YbiS/YcfS/YnhG family protein [Ancylobacter novellus DSM 506]
MRGDSGLLSARQRAAVQAAAVAVALTALAAAGPAQAQSGVYGYQSSYQLYSRSAASNPSAWRPGNAPVYPSGSVYQPPRPSADVGAARGVYGYAPPARRTTTAPASSYAASANPSGYDADVELPPAPVQAAAPTTRQTKAASRSTRGTATRTAAVPASYTVEDDIYDDPDTPLPLYRPSTGAKGVDRKFDRHVVRYSSSDPAGTIIVDTGARYLYLIQGDGTAVRYGIGVGKEGFQWAGSERISRKAEWPEWRPPSEMLDRRPDLPRVMPGGEDNPLGARALYLGKSLYRIHGSNEPETIGQAVSSGCIRMRNEDVIDLYGRVQVGTLVRVI